MRGLQRVGQPLGVLLSQKKEKIVKIMNPGGKSVIIVKVHAGKYKCSQTMEVGVRITCFQACYWWRLLEKEMPFDGRFRPKPI